MNAQQTFEQIMTRSANVISAYRHYDAQALAFTFSLDNASADELRRMLTSAPRPTLDMQSIKAQLASDEFDNAELSICDHAWRTAIAQHFNVDANDVELFVCDDDVRFAISGDDYFFDIGHENNTFGVFREIDDATDCEHVFSIVFDDDTISAIDATHANADEIVESERERIERMSDDELRALIENHLRKISARCKRRTH